MVHRMLWTLKGNLQTLPAILLGIRTTFKEDLQALPAEILCITGELLMSQGSSASSPHAFIVKVRRFFKPIRQAFNVPLVRF